MALKATEVLDRAMVAAMAVAVATARVRVVRVAGVPMVAGALELETGEGEAVGDTAEAEAKAVASSEVRDALALAAATAVAQPWRTRQAQQSSRSLPRSSVASHDRVAPSHPRRRRNPPQMVPVPRAHIECRHIGVQWQMYGHQVSSQATPQRVTARMPSCRGDCARVCTGLDVPRHGQIPIRCPPQSPERRSKCQDYHR